MGLQVSGTYQGIPLLDCEYEHRVGLEPGRGWCRFKLSDIGGVLKANAKIQQLKAFLNRDGKNFAEVQTTFTPNNLRGAPGATVAGTKSKPPPAGFKNLEGPFGTLELLTVAGDGLPATQVTFKNIFWAEMILEDISSVLNGEGIVRLELVDERVLWGMGGYVVGWRNRTINDLQESVGGKIFQWDPALENPSGLVDISRDITNAEEFRPILDPLTLFKREIPWTVFLLLGDVFQTIPGPPEVSIFAEKIAGVTPWNEEYGGGKLSKTALDDLKERYRLVIAPNYDGAFTVYDQGQTNVIARGRELESPAKIPGAFGHERNNSPNAVNNSMTPVAYEIIGDRIIEEVACPHWVNVVRDDGSIFENGANGVLGRQGKWVEMEGWLEAVGVSLEGAKASLIASYDKSDSTAFIDLFGGDKDDPVTKARASLMKQHFFKSFMVAPGPFRKYLPMLVDRPDGSIPAFNLPNLTIQRPASFFADGWTPSAIREIGGAPLFINSQLERVDPEGVKVTDKEQGVITFTEPRGVIVLDSGFAFVETDNDDLAFAREAHSNWLDLVDRFQKSVQNALDNLVFIERTPRKFLDEHFPFRELADKFIRENALSGSAIARVIMDEKNIALIRAKALAITPEPVPTKDGAKPNTEAVNLSECTIVEPRILSIWGWERNYGLSSDWYRFRGGEFPELSPMPIAVEGLTQYITLTGATNKKALDILSDIQIRQLEEKSKKSEKATTSRHAGFHPVALSGIVDSVAFKMSVQEPPEAETIVSAGRLEHGIEGRPPAVQTWSAFRRPLGRGYNGPGGGPVTISAFGRKRNGRQ